MISRTTHPNTDSIATLQQQIAATRGELAETDARYRAASTMRERQEHAQHIGTLQRSIRRDERLLAQLACECGA